jgi:hypothetical protein
MEDPIPYNIHDHVFEKGGVWYFFNHRALPEGPYKDEDTAIRKFAEFQMYLHAGSCQHR